MTAVTCDLWTFIPGHISICQRQRRFWPPLCVARGFPRSQLKCTFCFPFAGWNSIQISNSDHVFRKQQHPTTKVMYYICVQSQLCSDRLDTLPLRLPLSGRARTPLLNAPVSTSIKTVQQNQRAKTDLIQHAPMTHGLSGVTSNVAGLEHFKTDAKKHYYNAAFACPQMQRGRATQRFI